MVLITAFLYLVLYFGAHDIAITKLLWIRSVELKITNLSKVTRPLKQVPVTIQLPPNSAFLDVVSVLHSYIHYKA